MKFYKKLKVSKLRLIWGISLNFFVLACCNWAFFHGNLTFIPHFRPFIIDFDRVMLKLKQWQNLC